MGQNGHETIVHNVKKAIIQHINMNIRKRQFPEIVSPDRRMRNAGVALAWGWQRRGLQAAHQRGHRFAPATHG